MNPRLHRPLTGRRRLARSLVLLLLPALTCSLSCAVNPVTGKHELMLVTESDEVQIGAQGDQQIVAQYGLASDAALAGYIEQIGNKLVPVSHRPDLKFHFRLLDDSVVNAFALPGGYVYITRGILAYLPDEAALAGVMGHEVGHVTARHGAQRQTQQQLYGLGLGLGSAISKTVAQYAGLASEGLQLLLLKYSRDDERQADALGVEYATKIHYDTQEMANFFDTLGKLTAGGGRLPAWQSTHPDPGERYVTVGTLTKQRQAEVGGGPFVKQRDPYIQHLEGLIFGSDPRNGFVKDGQFMHPGMALRFAVPAGWSVQNSASQVALAPKEGDALVMFSLAGSQADPGAAADAFVQKNGVQVSQRFNVQISGQPAVRLVSSKTSEGSAIGVVSTFVSLQGKVYAFHGLAELANFDAKRAALVAPADGFGPLTDPAALAMQPVVLHIVPAPQSAPFRTAVAGFPIPEGAGIDLAGLALMNGLTLDSPVQKGVPLRVLRRRAAS